jgi:hypothetical protein
MSVGQHKAIAIAPLGVGRVVTHKLMKEEIHGGGIAQGRPRVPALCLLYGIHGKKPQRIDGQLIQFTHSNLALPSRILRFPVLMHFSQYYELSNGGYEQLSLAESCANFCGFGLHLCEKCFRIQS